jgi:hypothetical protein
MALRLAATSQYIHAYETTQLTNRRLPLSILLSSLALIIARVIPVGFLELAVIPLRLALQRVPVFTLGIVRATRVAFGFLECCGKRQRGTEVE